MEGPKAIPLTRIHECNQVENLPPAREEGVRVSQRLKGGCAQCPAQSAERGILTPLESAAKFPEISSGPGCSNLFRQFTNHHFKGTPSHEIPKGLLSFDLNAWIIFTIPVMGSLFAGS